MINDDWLKELKVGDKVIIHGPYQSKSVGVVERLTKTQIILAGGSKFKLDDGYNTPRQQWHNSLLRPFNQKDYDEIILKNVRENLGRVNWSDYDKETVFKVWNLIVEEKHKKEQKQQKED